MLKQLKESRHYETLCYVCVSVSGYEAEIQNNHPGKKSARQNISGRDATVVHEVWGTGTSCDATYWYHR
jgi:hypothetical protein